jgi:hypothetical protein
MADEQQSNTDEEVGSEIDDALPGAVPEIQAVAREEVARELGTTAEPAEPEESESQLEADIDAAEEPLPPAGNP